MFGKSIRAACVLGAAGLVLLALQGALASLYLIPRSQLLYLSARHGVDGWAISNEEDGVYLLWNSFYDPMPPDAVRPYEWYDPALAPTLWRGGVPRSVWGWPGFVYRVEPRGWVPADGGRGYRTLWLPRLPLAGLLLLWPALRWWARKLARRPGFPVVP